MPIDARIPLGVGSPQMPNYAAQYGNVLRLREMIRRADDQQTRRDRLQEEETRSEALRDAWVFDSPGSQQPERTLGTFAQQGPSLEPERNLASPDARPPGSGIELNRAGTIRNLIEIDPGEAYKVQQGWRKSDTAARLEQLKTQTAQSDADMAELDQFSQGLQVTGQLAAAVTDAESYRRFVSQARDFKLLTDEEVEQYAEWDTSTKGWLEQKKKEGLTVIEQAKAKRDELVKNREKIEFDQAQLERDLALASQLAPTVTDQESLNTLRDLIGENAKTIIGDLYTPKTPEMLESIGRTAQERASGEAAATKLDVTETAKTTAKREAKQETQEQRKQKRFDDLQAAEDKLLAEEDELHAANEGAGPELETITAQIEKARNEDEDEVAFRQLDVQRRAVEAKIAENQARIGSLQKQRADIIQRKNRVYGTRPATSGSTATPTGKPRTVDPATGKSPKSTEADIRKRAKAAGIDPDILIEDAKALGLL